MFEFFSKPPLYKILPSPTQIKYYSLEDQVQIKDALEYHRRKAEYHQAMVKMLEVRMIRAFKTGEKMNKLEQSLKGE